MECRWLGYFKVAAKFSRLNYLDNDTGLNYAIQHAKKVSKAEHGPGPD